MPAFFAVGFHLWCERHRLLVVFPCGWWERGPAPRNISEQPRRLRVAGAARDRPAVTNAIPSGTRLKDGRYLRRVRCAPMKINTGGAPCQK
jgi:hypothetical protein